jgi:hypothetical protein
MIVGESGTVDPLVFHRSLRLHQDRSDGRNRQRRRGRLLSPTIPFLRGATQGVRGLTA